MIKQVSFFSPSFSVVTRRCHRKTTGIPPSSHFPQRRRLAGCLLHCVGSRWARDRDGPRSECGQSRVLRREVVPRQRCHWGGQTGFSLQCGLGSAAFELGICFWVGFLTSERRPCPSVPGALPSPAPAVACAA